MIWAPEERTGRIKLEDAQAEHHTTSHRRSARLRATTCRAGRGVRPAVPNPENHSSVGSPHRRRERCPSVPLPSAPRSSDDAGGMCLRPAEVPASPARRGVVLSPTRRPHRVRRAFMPAATAAKQLLLGEWKMRWTGCPGASSYSLLMVSDRVVRPRCTVPQKKMHGRR